MALALKMIFAIVCLILQFLVFLFVLVATPVDAFKLKRVVISNAQNCYSMWGLKRCGAHAVSYSNTPYKGFPCSGIRDLMSCAGAFAIFSIIVTLAAFILTVINLAGVFKTANLVAFILGIVAFVTTLISWACMAGAKDRSCNGVKPMSLYNYVGAFGLMVTAWVLQIIVCVLIFFA